MKKRILALALAVMLCFGMLPIGTYAASSIAFEINSVDDLKSFANRVNNGKDTLNAILMTNLSLTGAKWTPIVGKQSTGWRSGERGGYGGVFDGNGHTISGMTINSTQGDGCGFFERLGENGEIKNLNLTDIEIRFGVPDGYPSHLGGIAFISYGKVLNCSFSGTITGDDPVSLGGIVAVLEEGGVVEDCVSNVDITVTVTEEGQHMSGYIQVGGIVGDSSGLINRCTNNGSIRVNGPVHSCSNMIGGIVASCSYRSVVSNCKNTGSISVTGYGDKEYLCIVGGIAGSHNVIPIEGVPNPVVINSCNTGSIYAEISSSRAMAGGLIGISQNADTYNCWTSGVISDKCDNGILNAAIGFVYVGTKQSNNYYLNDCAPSTGAGTGVSASELRDGTLAHKLNEYVQSNPNKGLLTWAQMEEGPIFGSPNISKEPFQSPSAWAADASNWIKGYPEIYEWFDGYWQYEICREEFAAVTVTMVEQALDKALSAAPASTFTDTSDTYVLKAYKAGIVSGTSATTFDPSSSLTREQLATMLYRAIRYIEQESGKSVLTETGTLDKFTDEGQVSSWANEAITALTANTIMSGTSSTALSPKSTATIEQALVLALRVLNGLK